MNSIHAKPFGSAVLESEIAALRKENAKLREALRDVERIACSHRKGAASDMQAVAVAALYPPARAALSGDKQPS